LAKNSLAGFLGQHELLDPGVRLWLEARRDKCGF
jgi:hypothetical protein